MVSGKVHGVEVAEVEAAIRAAEQRTSGEIRVAVARFYFWGDVRRAARHAFARLRMTRTRHRSGVLVFVAPRRRQIAIVADVGLDERVGPPFWREVVESLTARAKRGDLTGGLVEGIARIGGVLATACPPEPNAHANELPDAVAVMGHEPKPP
ncbi:MAG TPA: TPM domain-containing protein [Polyangia bacterium]|nr:TPM domain-containing protein [Polyangia bacterium]